jgi:multicomponent Na+:H+ antiporter subunit E
MFLVNILLALAWAALTGQFTPINLAFGFLLGYLTLWLAGPLTGSSNYPAKLPRVIRLVVFFVWELILANLRVAMSVLSPIDSLKPGIVAIPLDVHTDAGITLLANLITLTPGSLSLDVSRDRRVLYIHVIDLEDAEEVRRAVKDGFERRIREALE